MSMSLFTFLICFSSDFLNFELISFLPTWLNLFLKHFIIFQAIANGIDFFIFFWIIYYYYIKIKVILASWFCICNLTEFVNSFQNLCGMYSIGIYIYIWLCHLWKEIFLIFLLKLYIFYFSCLISLPRTSSTMMNRCGKSGYSFLGDIKILVLPFSLMLAVFINSLHYVKEAPV